MVTLKPREGTDNWWLWEIDAVGEPCFSVEKRDDGLFYVRWSIGEVNGKPTSYTTGLKDYLNFSCNVGVGESLMEAEVIIEKAIADQEKAEKVRLRKKHGF